MNIWYLAGGKPKLTLQALSVLGDPVRKSLIKIRVNVNSIDWICPSNNGNASTAYNKIVIHLLRNKLKTTGSDAQRSVFSENGVKRGGEHWRHMANTTEPSMQRCGLLSYYLATCFFFSAAVYVDEINIIVITEDTVRVLGSPEGSRYTSVGWKRCVKENTHNFISPLMW